MEVFSQQARDALYGSYFLFASDTKAPDLLRVINFTATGVQFGRVQMNVEPVSENCTLSSAPLLGAELLPVPGGKQIIKIGHGKAEKFIFKDKTGNVYTRLAAAPSCGTVWVYRPEEPKPKRSGGGTKRKAPTRPAHNKTETAAVEEEDEDEQADGADTEVLDDPPAEDKPQKEQEKEEVHHPPVKRKAVQPVATARTSKTTPAENKNQATSVRGAADASQGTTKRPRSPTLDRNLEAILNQCAPNVAQFAEDLREGDLDD
jgi:hypothetical protein